MRGRSRLINRVCCETRVRDTAIDFPLQHQLGHPFCFQNLLSPPSSFSMNSSSPTSDSAARTSLLAKLLRVASRPDLGPVIALLIITALFGIADQMYGKGVFLSRLNLQYVSQNAAIVAVPALGMTIIIIAGGIDLSAGTAVALCSVVLAYGLENSLGWPATLAVTLLAGLGCGLLNGLLIVTTRIVPFIVTLGTMTIFVGLGSLITKELSLAPPTDTIPTWLRDLSSSRASDLGF